MKLLKNILLLSSVWAVVPLIHAQESPQNTTVLLEYDAEGNPTKVTDPRGQITELTYNELHQQYSASRPAPVTGAARPVVTTEFTYRGELKSLTDPRKLQTTAKVNGFGETTLLTSPDTGQTTSTFDANGNILTSTDARNITTTYRHDALNRLKS